MTTLLSTASLHRQPHRQADRARPPGRSAMPPPLWAPKGTQQIHSEVGTGEIGRCTKRTTGGSVQSKYRSREGDFSRLEPALTSCLTHNMESSVLSSTIRTQGTHSVTGRVSALSCGPPRTSGAPPSTPAASHLGDTGFVTGTRRLKACSPLTERTKSRFSGLLPVPTWNMGAYDRHMPVYGVI
jgi:hypothetical protein